MELNSLGSNRNRVQTRRFHVRDITLSKEKYPEGSGSGDVENQVFLRCRKCKMIYALWKAVWCSLRKLSTGSRERSACEHVFQILRLFCITITVDTWHQAWSKLRMHSTDRTLTPGMNWSWWWGCIPEGLSILTTWMQGYRRELCALWSSPLWT